MKGLDPAEVCDVVFGVYTRDTPVPNLLACCVPQAWHASFPGPQPEWYVTPWRLTPEGKRATQHRERVAQRRIASILRRLG